VQPSEPTRPEAVCRQNEGLLSFSFFFFVVDLHKDELYDAVLLLLHIPVLVQACQRVARFPVSKPAC
jgi:hypothetical protein